MICLQQITFSTQYVQKRTNPLTFFIKKCITFWSDRDIFDEASIAYMRQVIVQPALIPPLAIPNVPYASPSLPPKVQMVSPSKPYYELPAGLMTLVQVRNSNKKERDH